MKKSLSMGIISILLFSLFACTNSPQSDPSSLSSSVASASSYSQSQIITSSAPVSSFSSSVIESPVADYSGLTQGMQQTQIPAFAPTMAENSIRSFDPSNFTYESGYNIGITQASFLYSEDELYFIASSTSTDRTFYYQKHLYHIGANDSKPQLILENVNIIAGMDKSGFIYLVQEVARWGPNNTLIRYNPVSKETEVLKEGIGTAAVHLSDPGWMYYTVGGAAIGYGGIDYGPLEIWRKNMVTGEETLLYQDAPYITTEYDSDDYENNEPITIFAHHARFYTDMSEGNSTLYIELEYDIPVMDGWTYDCRIFTVHPDGTLHESDFVKHFGLYTDAGSDALDKINGHTECLPSLGYQYDEAMTEEDLAQALNNNQVAIALAQDMGYRAYSSMHGECFKVGDDFYAILWLMYPDNSPRVAVVQLDAKPEVATSYKTCFYSDYSYSDYFMGAYACQVGHYLVFFIEDAAIFIYDTTSERVSCITEKSHTLWTNYPIKN